MSPRKSEWVSGSEAARILSENSGHEIKQNYVRLLAMHGKIAHRKKDGRTSEYLRSDLESRLVKKRRSSTEVETQQCPQYVPCES